MSLAQLPQGPSTAFEPELAEVAAEMLKAVAHPLRLRILARLSQNPENVTSLCSSLGAPQAIVSQQLRILRSHQLVGVTRKGGFATYWLAEPRITSLLGCVSSCLASHFRGQAR